MSPDEPGGLGRRLVRNTLHAASGRLVWVLAWLFLTPPILRTLGPERFGIWSLFFALTGYLVALDFGLSQATLQHVSAALRRGDEDGAASFPTLAALVYLALGAAWLAAMLGLRGPVLEWLSVPAAARAEAGFVLVASAVVFTLCGLTNLTMAIAQGFGRFDLANRVQLALTAQQVLGVPVVLHYGWGLRGLVVNIGLGWVLGGGLGLLMVRRAAPGFRWRSPGEAWSLRGQALRFGGPMQVANALAMFHTQMDKFLLARFAGLAAVTPYELGFRVAAAAGTFPQLLLLAVLPAVAALHAGEQGARLAALYDRGNRYVLALGGVLLAAVLAGADRLFMAWLGPGHGDGALVLRGLAVSGFVALATGMGTSTARGIARTDLEAWFAAVVLTTHLGLSLWLLPRLGLAGAVIAIVAANLVGAVFFLWRLARALGWSSRRLLLDPHGVPLLAVLAGGGAGWALSRGLPAASGAAEWGATFLAGGLAGAVALGLALALRYVNFQEARALILPRAATGDGRS